MSFLLSFIPWQKLVPYLGFGGLIAGLFIKSKADQVKADEKKTAVTEKIVENHAVAQKELAAITDEEADAALDADARTERP